MSIECYHYNKCLSLVSERSGLLHSHLGQDGVDALWVGQLGVVPLLPRPVHRGGGQHHQALHQQQQEDLQGVICVEKLCRNYLDI